MKYILLLSLLLSSCSKSYDLGSESQVNVEVSDSELTTPTWNSPIYKIVETKCATCHSRYRDQFVPANTPSYYDDLLDEDFFELNSPEILDRINDEEDPMPPNFSTPLTQREKQALRNYINQF